MPDKSTINSKKIDNNNAPFKSTGEAMKVLLVGYNGANNTG